MITSLLFIVNVCSQKAPNGAFWVKLLFIADSSSFLQIQQSLSPLLRSVPSIDQGRDCHALGVYSLCRHTIENGVVRGIREQSTL